MVGEKSKESERQRGDVSSTHTVTRSAMRLYTPRDGDLCTAALRCRTLSCRGNNLGNSFCLDLVLNDSLKKLLDTSAVTMLFAEARDRKGPKKILLCAFHVCWSCVNTVPQGCTWKNISGTFCWLCSLLCESLYMWVCVCYVVCFFLFLPVAGWKLWFCSVSLCVSRVTGSLPMIGFPLERLIARQRHNYLLFIFHRSMWLSSNSRVGRYDVATIEMCLLVGI